MVFEGLIPWIANATFLAVDAITDIESLAEYIHKNAKKPTKTQSLGMISYNCDIKYFHPDIALFYELAKLSYKINLEFNRNETTVILSNFIKSIDTKRQIPFCNQIQLFLRGIFLSNIVTGDDWHSLLQILVNVVKINQTVAIDFVWSMLYQLPEESDPKRQLELLRGTTSFAVVKVSGNVNV